MLTEIKNLSSRYRMRIVRYHAGLVRVGFGETKLAGGVLDAWKSRNAEQVKAFLKSICGALWWRRKRKKSGTYDGNVESTSKWDLVGNVGLRAFLRENRWKRR